MRSNYLFFCFFFGGPSSSLPSESDGRYSSSSSSLSLSISDIFFPLIFDYSRKGSSRISHTNFHPQQVDFCCENTTRSHSDTASDLVLYHFLQPENLYVQVLLGDLIKMTLESIGEKAGPMFESSVNQPPLDYNYLVLLSVQRQPSTNDNNIAGDCINMAWTALESTTGAALDSTEVHIYKDYTLEQALQKVFHSQQMDLLTIDNFFTV